MNVQWKKKQTPLRIAIGDTFNNKQLVDIAWRYESHVAASLPGHNYLLSRGYVVGTTHGFMSVLIILGPQLRNAKSWAPQTHHLVAGTNGVNDGGSFAQAEINNQP